MSSIQPKPYYYFGSATQTKKLQTKQRQTKIESFQSLSLVLEGTVKANSKEKEMEICLAR